MSYIPGPDEVGQVSKSASQYWDVLARIVPITVVGGGVAVVVNLMSIAHERTWLRRLLSTVSVLSVGCVAAGVAALGLRLFMPAATPEIELLAGALAGSSGQKIFDIYARKLFGLRTRLYDDVTADAVRASSERANPTPSSEPRSGAQCSESSDHGLRPDDKDPQ